eukprot:jgi/Psemu1/311615/fgenesh1_kg.797_\
MNVAFTSSTSTHMEFMSYSCSLDACVDTAEVPNVAISLGPGVLISPYNCITIVSHDDTIRMMMSNMRVAAQTSTTKHHQE